MSASLRPAGWTDLEAAYALAAATDTRLFGVPEFELVHLRGAWERPSFEVGRDNWVATEAGAITGYAEVSGDDQVTLWLNGPVGAQLLRCVESRAAERGAKRLYAIVPSADELACHAFAAAGYASAREVWRMEIALREQPSPPNWPVGASVRTYDPGADARAVHRLLEEAFATSAEAVPAFEDWHAWMTRDSSFDPDVWFLTEIGEQLAGVALCWKEGFVKDLAVHPSLRRRGLGEALLLHVFGAFYRRGAAKVALKVDSTNPTGAIRLYERAGMRVDRRYRVYEKQLP